jgi:hypothetical protein
VNTDPGNYSAHRFLADSYAALPRHEFARVSELLQSQLLQPINITPVQPHLTESNLYILEGAGPSDLSFNEFNPLFNRNRIGLQLSGIAGENDTFGNEIVAAGVHGNVSFSIGQFHHETDGWRENNDQNQNIYNVFTQISLSHKTNVQAEFRSKDLEQGDRTLNFFQDYWPNLRSQDDMKSLRLGFYHAFSPGSSVIGSLVYSDGDSHLNDVSMGSEFDVKTDLQSYTGEIQYLVRLKNIHIISGAGITNSDYKDVITNEITDPPIRTMDVTESDIKHANLYLYSQINYIKNLSLTAGASADFFDGGIIDRDQLNPKLGLLWDVSDKMTVRTAVFRTFNKSHGLKINKQTIEPTHVAGFTQLFDDAEGTESWRYGIALDRKLSKNIYGGIEYSWRNLKVPYQSVETPPPPPPSPDQPPPPPQLIVEIKRVDWREQLGRAYLYLTPHPWIAVAVEYLYERFDRDREFVGGIEEVKTHRFPLSVHFYHPAGFSTRLKATYYNQEGAFLPQDLPLGSPAIEGSDQFWIVDASISYRLPKRFGIITIGARNLFDESFNYQDTDPASPVVQPERFLFARFTVAL